MQKPADNEYPIHDLIRKRWSPRALDPRPIPPEHLRSLFEAARWAASSFNEQPWRFIVARHEETEEFERALGCLGEFNRRWARNAGLLILTVARRNFSRNDKPNRVAVHDIGLAAATLSLQATELGLFVHQMAGVDLDKVRETYAVPEGFDPVTAIAVGYAGDPEKLPEKYRESEGAPRKRKPQDEFVFSGAWERAATW